MDKNGLIIIGIGASAGGLEALQSFVSGLPDNSSMAYVVAQHLSPTYKSLMADLLGKGTELPVIEAKHGLVLKADTIYICPPNKNITIQDNMIALKEPKTATYGPKPSIDLFFESLAISKGDKSAGIILSGTGSDGSRGVRAIKAEGGFAIAQDPSTAKYDGMPNAAINTRTVDLILKPEQIGTELLEIFSYPERPILVSGNDENLDVFQSILNKLNNKKGIDFTLYKPNTIQRRIERRMAALKVTSITTYHNHIMKHEDELEALFKDILIGVTAFFRDHDAFDALAEQLKKRIEMKKNRHIRIWAPGCSTGEEAYSIAMVVSEVLGNDIPQYKVQIFATDIDEEATMFARKGIYPESALVEMDKSMRNKYFIIKNEQFEIIKPIREMCIFSKHDITRDPSFLRLDLITCRNLLIYFSQELQKKLIPMFHYALNDNGLLFLGKSETVGHFQSYFKNMDKKWKIYEANYLGKKEPPAPVESYDAKSYKKETAAKEEFKTPTIPELMVQHINQHIIPTCVVINNSDDIVYVKGKNPYLVRPEGEQTDNIYRNVIPLLSVELRAAIHVSMKEQHITKTNYQKVILADNAIRYVRMVIVPMDNERVGDLMMICFQEEDGENLRSYEINNLDNEEEKTTQLELELLRTKEHLQTVIEELETSNEEMQSLNEELQSSNEELQSSNEELETTNEELQSTNEELQTAYTEMRAMYDEKELHSQQLSEVKTELEIANTRLETSLEASNVGIYEHSIPVQQDDYWSDLWAELLGYNLGELPADKRNMLDWIQNLTHPEDVETLKQTFDAFISGQEETYSIRFRMKHKRGNWIWIESFAKAVGRDIQGKVTHIIGTTRNITDDIEKQKQLESLSASLNDAQIIASIGSWEWNIETGEIWWSDNVYKIFGLEKNAQELSYQFFLSLIHEEERETIDNAIKQALNNKGDYDLTHQLKRQDKEVIVREIGTVIRNEQGKALKMLGTVQDITHQTQIQQKMKTLNRRYEEAQEIAGIGNWEWDAIRDKMWWSDYLYKKFNVDPNTEMTLDGLSKMIHPDDLPMFQEDFQQALEGKKQHDVTVRMFQNDEIRYIHGRGSVEFDSEGKPIRAYGTAQDVTENVRYRQSLEENEKRLHLAMKATELGTWSWYPEKNEIIWDSNSYEMFGVDPDTKVTFELCQSLFHPDDRKELEHELREAIDSNTHFDIKFRIILPDGSIRKINGTGTVMPQADNTKVLVGINRDISYELK